MAQYWIARNTLREKFGLTADQADKEEHAEAMIHLKIWELVGKRQENEQKKAERGMSSGQQF